MLIMKLKKYMKNKLKIRKDRALFGRRIMSAAMCALLTLQPLSGVFALDASDGGDADENSEYNKYTETVYEDADIDVKYTDTVYKGADYSWYVSAGAGASSYTIADAASLKGLANLVNGTDLPDGEITVTVEDGTTRSAVLSQTDFAGKTVTLINDIDLSKLDGGDSGNDGDDNGDGTGDGSGDSDVAEADGGENGDESGDSQNGNDQGSENDDTATVSGWTPVGTQDTPFRGIFDGHGRSIKNLKVTDESMRGGSAAGLFGYAAGEIRNVTLSGSVDISGAGSADAGMLAGVLTGKAVNINVDGDVSIVNGNAGGVTGAAQQGASVERAVSGVSVSAGAQAAAGIIGCGAAGASVTDSYNTGEVSSDSTAGGIATGEISVSGCFNTGSVKGAQSAYAIGGAAENCFALDSSIAGGADDYVSDSVSDAAESAESGVSLAPAEAFSNGTVAWKLNTASGTQKNSETWTQGAAHPEFASESSKGAVYRLVMSIAAGVDVTARYSGGDAGSIGSEKAENKNSENENADKNSDRNSDEISKTDIVNYYYIKGKTIELTAKAAVADKNDGDNESDSNGDADNSGEKTFVPNLAYAVIKDSMGRTAFSASTKSFATDGLILSCSPSVDSMSGEVLTYDDAEADSKVNVTFDANGGCFGGDADKVNDIISIAYGSFISEAIYDEDDPEYIDGPAEFTGWYMDKACSIPVDANAILVDDATLYAGWIKQCEVTFDLNGYGGDEDVSDWPLVIKMYTGSPADAQTAPVWTSTSNSNGTITRHNFLGWFTEPEGGEAWNFDMPVTESMTLYAHWEHVEAAKPDSSSGGVTSISGGESFQKLLGTIQDGMSYAGQTITFDEDIELDDAVVISSFDGILDGQGHTLKLNKKQFTSTGNMTALFRNLKKGAEIRNINIVYEDGGDVSSSAKFAVLCDTNHGTIKNCTLKLNIRKSGSAENFGGGFVRVNAADGVISGCAFKNGSSISFNGSFGGIVGENRGQVSGCTVEQNVKISASRSAGGIAYRLAGEASEASSETPSETDPSESGDQQDPNGSSGANDPTDEPETSSGPAAVRNCSVSGDITSDMNSKRSSAVYYVGGIVAEADAGAGSVITEKCFVDGNVEGRGAAGGIVGVMRGGTGSSAGEDADNDETCLTEGCYSTGSVSEAAAVGGIAGLIRGGSVKYCYSTAALKGAEEFLGGIAGAGGNSEISSLADDDDASSNAAVESCYWFGSEFSAGRGAEQGMFCGGKSENVTVKNCYFGATDDKPDCVSDAHLSDDDADAAVKKASEFADGSVAWALETFNGAQKEHIRKFSMNTKPAQPSAKAASSDYAGDGDDAYAFVRDANNYSSPVLSSDSIYRAEVTYDESTDQDVTYDKTKDYVKITVGKTSIRAYGGASAAGGEPADPSEDKDPENSNTQNDAAIYMYGSGTLTWREYSNDLHSALSDLIEKLIIEENDDSYNILNTYTVTISDTDGNVLDSHKSTELNRLGKSATYKLGGYDLKIDADVFKTITKKQIVEEEDKNDKPEEPKPSGGRHHSSSSGSQSGNTNGNGGNGTNEDANGTNNGNGVNDSGAPARPEQTVPVISNDANEQVSLTLPNDAEQPSDVDTEQPDAEPETAEEAAPDSGEQPDAEPEQKQDEPEQQPEQAQPQTVFEVIRKSVEENPVSMVAAGIIFIVIIAAAAVHRIRRDR